MHPHTSRDLYNAIDLPLPTGAAGTPGENMHNWATNGMLLAHHLPGSNDLMDMPNYRQSIFVVNAFCHRFEGGYRHPGRDVGKMMLSISASDGDAQFLRCVGNFPSNGEQLATSEYRSTPCRRLSEDLSFRRLGEMLNQGVRLFLVVDVQTGARRLLQTRGMKRVYDGNLVTTAAAHANDMWCNTARLEYTNVTYNATYASAAVPPQVESWRRMNEVRDADGRAGRGSAG